MLVPLIPAPFHNFTCVGLIFLLRGVSEESYIVVHVKIEQRSGFSTSFVDDKVVECIVLQEKGGEPVSWKDAPNLLEER